FIYKSTDNMMIQMLAQKEAGYSTKDGEVLIFNETTEEILTEIGKHSKSKSFNTFKLIGYPANYLNAGQCIFAVDSTAGATWMGCDAPLIDIDEDNLVEFETVVMPIPQFNPEKPKMISQGPSICIFNREDPQEVVASWLFAQFMLTNSVQIAYSQTEGYAPVTTKAQESKEYTEYLSRSGENNDFYYPVKIAATKLLLDNTKNTFVTPVFNGSMSLRDAAGQLIESVNKSARRGQAVDESYISSLYDEVTSLCRLDQITVTSLGKLPTESALLLSAIGLCWVGMGAYLAYGKIKMKKTKKFRDNP
ncbi:MAG: extracellular solute-binding protein, partial [Clostridia bacterium]|nr:extracellular solute-binding protein [Clostridia bacterium]